MKERAEEPSGWLDDLMSGAWAPVLEPYGEGVHGWPGPALPWTVGLSLEEAKHQVGGRAGAPPGLEPGMWPVVPGIDGRDGPAQACACMGGCAICGPEPS
jgi:hypothetical protein